jgi:hypothetical protein
MAVVKSRGPDFDEAFAPLAPSSSRTDRDRQRGGASGWPTGTCAARISDTPSRRTMSVLSHGASFAADLIDIGGAIRDPRLTRMRAAAFREALLYSPGRRIGGGTDPEAHHR